jgi:hypothetical protein
MSWREISGEQNLRMAARMLEQQGEINDLEKGLATARREAALLASQRDALLAHCGEVEAAGGLTIALGDVYEIMITDPADGRRSCHVACGESTTTAPGPAPQEP